MEGKEVRFGISASALFAGVTTAASCGAVDARPRTVDFSGPGRGKPDRAGRLGRRLAPYNAAASLGSNLGPTSAALADRVKGDLDAFKAENARQPAPVDLVATSGSGLDPDLSPEAARFQVPRVAKARHLPEETVQDLVAAPIEGGSFGILGELRVNVLALNLVLDDLGR